MSIIGKRVFFLGGTAAHYKSTILLTLRKNNIYYTSSSDFIELPDDFPKL